MTGDAPQHRMALDVLSMMRNDGLSLSKAASIAGIPRRTVLDHVGRALVKRGSRWSAKPWDRIPRSVRFLDERGVFEVEARDSRTASRIARYWNAVDRFLKTGDERPLREFKTQSFTSHGVAYGFLTHSDVLQTLALVGEISFEDIYARAA